MMAVHDKVRLLQGKGVNIPHPSSVDIGEDVDIDKISGEGVVLHRGTRIAGSKTVISHSVKLGEEAPVTVIDCRLGSGVGLKGGFFRESVFLQEAEMASGAHVREGCILEEQVKGGHTVGLKQTILFPFVTLGSLINFCDCLMAGGTDRKNHSEVGSSYIHFNYTPYQDKATPSLLGDVPRGVMLNQPPIFLGGQGGLVGPLRIGYGTVVAAGTVYRRDCPAGGKLLAGGSGEVKEKDFDPRFFGDIRRKVYNNIRYIANLLALKQWYLHVRREFFERQQYGADLYRGAHETLETAIGERLKQFHALCVKVGESTVLSQEIPKGDTKDANARLKNELRDKWPLIRESLSGGSESGIDLKKRDTFLEIVHRRKEETDYLSFIRSLSGDEAALGTGWLDAVVEEMTLNALAKLPSWGS